MTYIQKKIHELNETLRSVKDMLWQQRGVEKYEKINGKLFKIKTMIDKVIPQYEKLEKNKSKDIDKKVKDLALYLDDWSDSLEISQAYYRHETGRILNALKVMEEDDDCEHDYTGELVYDLIKWERRKK